MSRLPEFNPEVVALAKRMGAKALILDRQELIPFHSDTLRPVEAFDLANAGIEAGAPAGGSHCAYAGTVASQWRDVMNEINDGGPAFPADDTGTCSFRPGMSLRDYFAAKILQGLCANPGAAFQANDRSGWSMVNCTDADLAVTAYSMADAMLKARAR